MDFKKLYPTEELTELTQWFAERLDRLPPSLRIDEGTYIPNLRKTVEFHLAIVEAHYNNPTYSPQIYLFFRMRDRLREEGHFKDE